MEVHHHPHVEKKNFKEYLLEGLMIFLAVSMGFIAENIREYRTDREREHQYMSSLHDDLQKDTAILNEGIMKIQSDLKYCDSTVRMYTLHLLLNLPDEDLVRMTCGTGKSLNIFFNDRTSSQLKNSGEVRLIRNKAVVDSLLQYWNNENALEKLGNRFETNRLEQRKIGDRTFNWFRFYYQASMGHDRIMDSVKIKTMYDPSNLNEFINTTSIMLVIGNTSLLPSLINQKKLATDLLKLLEKSYQINEH